MGERGKKGKKKKNQIIDLITKMKTNYYTSITQGDIGLDTHIILTFVL